MKTKKSIFSRLASMIVAAMSAAILCTLCMVSASAAEVETVASHSAAIVMQADSADANIDSAVNPPVLKHMGAAGGAAGSTATSADEVYTSVMDTIVKWISRVAWVIALFGGVMLGFSIKRNDAEGKEAAMLTLVSGLIVAALLTAADMFNIFV